MIPLKPCPFCGTDAVCQKELGTNLWFVGCASGSCHVEPNLYAHSEPEAMALWNTRATTAADRILAALDTGEWCLRKLTKGATASWAVTRNLPTEENSVITEWTAATPLAALSLAASDVGVPLPR